MDSYAAVRFGSLGPRGLSICRRTGLKRRGNEEERGGGQPCLAAARGTNTEFHRGRQCHSTLAGLALDATTKVR